MCSCDLVGNLLAIFLELQIFGGVTWCLGLGPQEPGPTGGSRRPRQVLERRRRSETSLCKMLFMLSRGEYNIVFVKGGATLNCCGVPFSHS
jgi:hypothetical protein